MNTQDQFKKLTDPESPTSESLSGSGATPPHTDPNLSPIFKLHHDILLQIFRINADMNQDRILQESERINQDASQAINVTRNSSQVNSLWRNLIIDSPILWANLIDMEYLDHRCNWWRKEVICRTDGSPLFIKGSISLASLDNSEPWWLEFFNDNWTRVRKIDLDVQSGFEETDEGTPIITPDEAGAKSRKALRFLSQPGIALEYFRLSLPYRCDPLESSSMLFSNCAPRLTVFEIHSMQFNHHQNTWLSQLHSLRIHDNIESPSHAQTFKSGHVLCQALSQMPHLETLSLEDAISDPSVSIHQNPIHLPHLQFLSINSKFRWSDPYGRDNDMVSTIWPLLDCIFPKPGCSVHLRLPLSYTGKIDVRALSRLAKNYFQFNQPTKLDILYGIFRWTLADTQVPLYGRERVTTSPVFNFFAFTRRYGPDRSLHSDVQMYQAFEALFGLSFPKVIHLRLEIAAPSKSLLSCHQLADLLSTFSSVKHVTTTLQTLDFLCESTAINASKVFPKLEVLHMPVGHIETYFHGGRLLLATLTRFLNSRKEAGFPVETLHYQSTELTAILDNLISLDDISGLKVVWSTNVIGEGSYICGSGNPAELDLKEKMMLALPGSHKENSP